MNIDAIFLLEDSGLSVSNSRFVSLNICAPLFKFIQTNGENSFKIFFEKTIFSNISLFSSNLLTFKGQFTSINFQKVSFNKVTQCLSIIKIANADCDIIMDSISFEKNFFEEYLVFVENSYNVSISNSISLYNNNGDGAFFDSGGGSFFFLNVLHKKVLNLTVSFAFSDKSTLGLKIIDQYYYYQNASSPSVNNFVLSVCIL